MESTHRFPVGTQADVELVRRAARTLAVTSGFGAADVECVALTVSELATNLLRYAVNGEIILGIAVGGGHGLRVESRDAGPGIDDLDAAMCDGRSTSGGLGSGLPGVRRLMDEMTITTTPHGTEIVAYKWLPTR